MSPKTVPRRRAPDVKILSESEIQEKLYGNYRGAEKSPEWTGSEILEGELNRLRSELVSLEKEKENLASRIRLQTHVSPAPSAAFRWAGPWMAAFVLLALTGYSGVKMLQASPVPVGEPTPYTVQVAVYDIRPMAEEIVEFLKHLEYRAYLVEMPRQDGRVQYRVYMGNFVTKGEADLERTRLTKDSRFRDFQDAFVRFR